MEKPDLERNLGEQPLRDFMKKHDLSPHDLVAVSPEPITHKMVSRACKGRWLTVNARNKLIRAAEAATGESLKKSDLFTY
ncbi:MAG: hypothetical protein ACO3N7_07550 [Kiritimatiellia bacterium]